MRPFWVAFQSSGGIFSPAQWVALRISDFHVRGALAPAENDPLSFLLMCDVVCHNAAAAQLVPLLERFELTVDLERKRNEICCAPVQGRHAESLDFYIRDAINKTTRGPRDQEASASKRTILSTSRSMRCWGEWLV